MEKVILEERTDECQQMDAWRAVPYDLQRWVLVFTGNGWAVIHTHTHTRTAREKVTPNQS